MGFEPSTDMRSIYLRNFLRIVRFGITGGIASGVYAIIAIVAVDMLGMSGLGASSLAYLVAIPVSFIGQKFWTFRATGTLERELPGFLAVQAINLVAAAVIMAILVDVLKLDRIVGVGAVVIAIPAMTYLLLSRKVFKERND